MARTLVSITLTLWALLALFAGAVARQPLVMLAPLYGLYPGEMASGESSYHPVMMHAWAIGAGVVFLALALIGALRNSKPAAVAFMVLFLLSTFFIIVRFGNSMRGLH